MVKIDLLRPFDIAGWHQTKPWRQLKTSLIATRNCEQERRHSCQSYRGRHQTKLKANKGQTVIAVRQRSKNVGLILICLFSFVASSSVRVGIQAFF